MPRPRKPANDQRPHRFTVRLSAAEQQAFQAQVQEAAASPSDYARRMLTQGRVEVVQARPALSLRAIMELNRIGVNLNQFTRTANATGRLPAGLTPLLERINTLLDEAMELEAIAEDDAEDPADFIEE